MELAHSHHYNNASEIATAGNFLASLKAGTQAHNPTVVFTLNKEIVYHSFCIIVWIKNKFFPSYFGG